MTGVVETIYGAPIAGALVRVPGGPEVTTGTDGKFSFDAGPSYDLVVVYPSSDGKKAVAAFEGLSRRDPTVAVSGGLKRNPADAVTVSVSGDAGAFPLPTPERIIAVVAPSSHSGPASGILVSGSSNSRGGLDFGWQGEAPLVGTLVALRDSVVTGAMPTAFKAYGEAPITLAPVTPASFDVPMAAITEGRVQGRVDTPWPTATLTYTLRKGAYALTYHASGVAPSFELPIPIVPGMTGTVGSTITSDTGESTGAWKTGIVAGAPPFVLQHPAEIHALAPDVSATNVDAAVAFRWTPPASSLGVTHLSVVCGASVTVYQLDLYTSKASAHLPDVSSTGVTWPTATECNWRVTASSGTPDSAAAPGSRSPLTATSDGQQSTTPYRKLQTR